MSVEEKNKAATTAFFATPFQADVVTLNFNKPQKKISGRRNGQYGNVNEMFTHCKKLK